MLDRRDLAELGEERRGVHDDVRVQRRLSFSWWWIARVRETPASTAPSKSRHLCAVQSTSSGGDLAFANVAPTPAAARLAAVSSHQAAESQPQRATKRMAAKDTTSKMFVVCGRDADSLYEAELNTNFCGILDLPIANFAASCLDNVDPLIATTPDVYLRLSTISTRSA